MEIHFMNAIPYADMIDKCKGNTQCPMSYMDTENRIEWWFHNLLFMREMKFGSKWKLCVSDDDLPIAIRYDIEEEIMQSLEEEGVCAGCERASCITCPYGNRDYYIGTKDCFGEDIN